ncbi:MAG: DEAD/DEAH box helicase [Desulforhopalus sp.]|jgi:DEAD/DEAH box helicase domain-containing protein|nr:DEAD/DEAH box helicase [Desulforhopalus sp.]
MNNPVSEYLTALHTSDRYGPQVVARRRILPSASCYSEDFPPLDPALRQGLQSLGINRLFSHQHQAISEILAGKNVVVATPTASGKSLIYNLPVVNELYTATPGHALYIFPLKALARDQMAALLRLGAGLDPQPQQRQQPLAALFDGDIPARERKKITSRPPTALITNPEMLHLALLPYHHNWAGFFASLRYVVIDEVHSYRGVFGSHMSWVIRRLQRIAAHYGARPTFVLLSATIGNPGELAEMLLGEEVSVITESGAPQAEKELVLLNPWNGAAHAAGQLLEAAMKRGLRTIVYTKSRKMTELIHLWSAPRLGGLANRLSAYRAGFLPEERREIEEKLFSGELLGVVSTSALELGIDIGDLDICILVGYPGSILATMQRAGRVGRGRRHSATVLIGGEDALDQYFMRTPEDFFTRTPESAVLNHFNPAIVDQHLRCAAAENVLIENEKILKNVTIRERVDILSKKGSLLETASGGTWLAAGRYPHRQVSLRGGGRQMAIIDGQSGEIVGEIDAIRGMRDCHPGAVYLHRTTSYLVDRFDFESGEVVVHRESPLFFTRPLSEKRTEIVSVTSRRTCSGTELFCGVLKVSEKITGFQRWHSRTRKLLGTFPLDLPELVIETEGTWLEIPAEVLDGLEKRQYHVMAALHALEHALIALLPLFILCDSSDLGGISSPMHPQTEKATIFVYDGHPGGIGLSQEAYQLMDKLLRQAHRTVESCPCENGCPSCVHSSRCGSGNRPIDRLACVALLATLLQSPSGRLEQRPLPPHQESAGMATAHLGPGRTEKGLSGPQPRAFPPGNFCVFDLETIRSAEEVGGWGRAERMGMALAVLYDSPSNSFSCYRDVDASRLVQKLQQYSLVVGFNNKRFDNRVLSAYTDANLSQLPSIDLLEEVHGHLGYRLSLHRLAETTLGTGKSADGLQSLQWVREGRLDLVERYCQRDVEITRDLFLYALQHGFLLFTNKAGHRVRLPLDLKRRMSALLQAGRPASPA